MIAIGFIDVLNDFMKEDGALYVQGAKELITPLRKLYSSAIDEDIPTFFVSDLHDGTEVEMQENGGPFPRHAMMNTEGAKSIITPELDDNQVVFTKRCYDVFDPQFGNKNLEPWLKEEGIETVMLVGVAFDYCVKAAAVGLAHRGINTYIASNFTAAISPATTVTALAEMYAAKVSVGDSFFFFGHANDDR